MSVESRENGCGRAQFPAARCRFRHRGRISGVKRPDSRFLQVARTPQVVCGSLPVQMQRRARQSNAAQRFLAHLRQSDEHVLEACTGLGDALVAPLSRFRVRLVLAALALDEHAPACACQPRFAFAINGPLVQVKSLAARCPLQAIAVHCIPEMSRRPGGRGHYEIQRLA